MDSFEEKALIDLNNINSGVPQTNFSDPYAQKRALMTEVASGGDVKFNDAYSRITTGMERETENYLRRKEEAAVDKTKVNVLQEYIKNKNGQPVSEAEMASIRALKKEDLSSEESLRSAVEANFAKNLMNRQLASNNVLYKSYNDSIQQDPETVDSVLKIAEERVANTRIAEKWLDMMKTKAEDQSWAGWGVDFAKKLVPGYSWYKKYNMAGNTSDANTFLSGQNMEAQVQYLYSLPPAKFEGALSKALTELAKDNPSLAEEFARNVVHYGSSERNLDNLFSILDLTIAGDVASLAGSAGKAVSKKFSAQAILKKGGKDVAEAIANPRSTAADIAAAAGDLDTAAVINATKAAQLKASGLTKEEAVREFADIVAPSLVRPEGFFAGSGRLSAAAAKTMADDLAESGGTLLKALSRPFGVALRDEQTRALGEAVSNTIENLSKVHGVDVNNAILDVTNGLNYRLTNNTSDFLRTTNIEVHIGTPQKGLFDSPELAENTARHLYNFREGDYEIAQQGGGFYVKIRRDVDIGADPVRSVLIETENKNPESLVNMIIGRARSADYIVSKASKENRKVAVNAAEEVKGWIEEAAKPLSSYLRTKENRDNLTRVLEQNRSEGRWYSSANEFETEWFKNHGTFPTAEDTKAYMHVRQISDLDYLVRNSEVYATKAHKGVMNFEFPVTIRNEGPEANALFNNIGEFKAKAYGPKFEGRLVDSLPKTGEYHRILILDEKGSGKVVNPRDLGAADLKAEYERLAKENYKLVQVYNPEEGLLNDFIPKGDNAPVNFVAVKELRSSMLDPVQVPYSGGPHKVYGAGLYIKQPKISKVIENGVYKGEAYGGDITLSAHRFDKEANLFVKDIEEGRKLLKANDPRLGAYVTSKLPMTEGEFRQLFREGGFSLDHEFKVYRDGQTFKNSNDLKALGIRDHTDSSFNMSMDSTTGFTGKKSEDIFDYRLGSTNNPVWRKEEAAMLDPLMAVRKGMNDVVNSVAFNEYRSRSADEWIEQFGDLLRPSQRELRNAPIWHMNNPEWITGPGVDQVRLAAAKQSLTAIQHLMSQPSSVKTVVETAKNKFVNFLFERNPKLGEYVADKVLYTTQDPLKYARGVAFHTKIGLFNPAQLFLQAQNLANMSAIAPKYAVGAMKDSMMMYLMKFNENPKVVGYFANKSGNPWFKESYQAMKDSGFLNISGNMSIQEALAEPALMKGKIGAALDFSSVFFKQGELMNRLGAWNIAYREFKANNPGVTVLSDINKRQILSRADDLTTNMTRASNAFLQNGFGSLPLQFFSYQWRLTEQIWTGLLGKGALTRGEAGRLLAFNGMMYGVPVGVAGPVAGLVWPWQESVEKYAQDNGINLDGSTMSKVFNRGLYEVLTEAATGKQFTIGERFGPGGMPTIKDYYEGRKSGLDVLLGASYTVSKDVFKNAYPAMMGVASVFRGPDKERPFTVDDVVDAFKTVSTVNNATKAWMVYNYGTYQTRTGVPIIGGDGISAGFMALLGVNPREVAVYYARKGVLDDQRKAIQEVSKLVETEIGRMMKAETQQEGETYSRRAWVYLEGVGAISEAQRNEIFTKALGKFKDEDFDNVSRRWMLKAPTNEKMDARMKLNQEQKNNGR